MSTNKPPETAPAPTREKPLSSLIEQAIGRLSNIYGERTIELHLVLLEAREHAFREAAFAAFEKGAVPTREEYLRKYLSLLNEEWREVSI